MAKSTVERGPWAQIALGHGPCAGRPRRSVAYLDFTAAGETVRIPGPTFKSEADAREFCEKTFGLLKLLRAASLGSERAEAD